MLAAGHTVSATAAAVEVHERTLFRWLQEPAFQAQIEQLRGDAWERAAAVLGTTSTTAAATLGKLLDDKSPWVRLHAARAVLELGARLREDVDLAARITALESALGENVLNIRRVK